MRPTLLVAADIGNTDTVCALFRGNRLVAEWRAPSAQFLSAARARQTLRLLLAEAGASNSDLRGAVISSVVPAVTRQLAPALRAATGRRPYIVAGTDPSGLRMGYRSPAKLGPDRLCNAVAARALYGAPVIVVDLGTAVTYDVVTRGGTFAGGAITAGIATTAAALRGRTAALPLVPLEFPDGPVGDDTVSCIQSGVMFGAVDAMDGMIRRIRAVTGRSTPVVATGGFAHAAAAHSQLITAVVPQLVLEGARLLYERNARARGTPRTPSKRR
jgi:type III pantothenate kinase